MKFLDQTVYLNYYQDFNPNLLAQLQEELIQIEEVLIEPKPFLVLSNQAGKGVHVSVRVWCESIQFIQTQNALVLYCLEFCNNSSCLPDAIILPLSTTNILFEFKPIFLA